MSSSIEIVIYNVIVANKTVRARNFMGGMGGAGAGRGAGGGGQ